MTTQTLQSTSTKTFVVRYEVTTYHAVEVERPENITEEDLLSSITRDELMSGEVQNDCAWDSLKSSWRDGNAAVYVYDEDDCYEDAFAEWVSF